MHLINGKVFLPDGHIKLTNISITDTIISDVGSSISSSDVIDVHGCYIIPGLIDTHLHGCNGADFSDGTQSAISTICNYELSCGITTILPATMTLPIPILEKSMCAFSSYINTSSYDNTADLAGIYLEGPFLSAKKAGAQAPEHLRLPDYSLFSHLDCLSNHNIRIVALAPELEKSHEFLSHFSNNSKVICSIGHTDASYNIAKQSFQEGVRRITHLYNAMNYPEDILSIATTIPNCMVELIGDGIHVSKERIKHCFELLGDDRVILISDSMRATGLGDGISSLGGQEVMVHGKLATLSNGKKAGSVSNLYDCFRTILSLGIPLESAIKSVTCNPGRFLPASCSHGLLQSGQPADLLILNPDYSIRAIMKKGILQKNSRL